MYTIFFLGRSIEGIMDDAQRLLGDTLGTPIVVTRDDEQLAPPAGVRAVAVSQFAPQGDSEYTVVANGGTAAQLAPVLVRLCRSDAGLKVLDLQRDGVHRLA